MNPSGKMVIRFSFTTTFHKFPEKMVVRLFFMTTFYKIPEKMVVRNLHRADPWKQKRADSFSNSREKAVCPVIRQRRHKKGRGLPMLIFLFRTSTFPHSPAIYGRRVETYGPYPHDYTREKHLLSYFHSNNQKCRLSINNRTILMKK